MAHLNHLLLLALSCLASRTAASESSAMEVPTEVKPFKQAMISMLRNADVDNDNMLDKQEAKVLLANAGARSSA